MRFDDIEADGHYWVGASNWRDGGLSRLWPIVVVKTGRWHHIRGECGPILVESEHAPNNVVAMIPPEYSGRHRWDSTRHVRPNVERILRPGDVRMDDTEFLRLHKIQKADQERHAAQRAEVEDRRVTARLNLLATFPFGGFVEPVWQAIEVVEDHAKIRGKYRKPKSPWGERKADRLQFTIDVRCGDLTKQQIQLVRELLAIKAPAC